MRLIIITGSESGKPIDLSLDRLKQAFPETEITKNSLPFDGVAIYDCQHVKGLDHTWARSKPYVLGDCEASKLIKTEQGPKLGDFLSAAIERISQGELDEPPEEAAAVTMI